MKELLYITVAVDEKDIKDGFRVKVIGAHDDEEIESEVYGLEGDL